MVIIKIRLVINPKVCFKKSFKAKINRHNGIKESGKIIKAENFHIL
jgi:hypothetical protein